MSTTRAIVILVIASIVYGVSFAVDQWFLLGAVFVLTLTALYGLGMMLASLFLVWGREAYQLTELFTEPVYFVSGLNFPVGRLGLLGALAIATIPSPWVSTRCVSSRSRTATAVRHAAARDRGADPRRDDRRLPARRPMDAPARWSGWPAAKAACRSDGSEAGRRGTRRRRAGSAPRTGAASTRRRTRGRGLRDSGAVFGPRRNLGWQMEANWTDPVLFFIYSVAKPVSADADPRGDARHHQRRRSAGVPRLRRGRDRAVVVRARAGWRGSPGRSSTTVSATGCSSTCT